MSNVLDTEMSIGRQSRAFHRYRLSPTGSPAQVAPTGKACHGGDVRPRPVSEVLYKTDGPSALPALLWFATLMASG